MRRNNLAAALLLILFVVQVVQPASIAQSGATGARTKSTKQVLKGEVGSTARFSGDVQSSPFGFESFSAGGRTTITKVTAGTQAWARGLQAGDQVIEQRPIGNAVAITIERGGRRYQANLSVTDTGSAKPNSQALSGNPKLQQQLAVLSNHNVSLIIDKSGSMSTRDCPGNVSRWKWCAEQTGNLSAAISGCLKDGLNIVVFSDEFTVYNNATVKQISQIFANNQPDGTTNTGDALQDQIDAYFTRKSLARGKTAPAVIAVITDGEPNKPDQVRQVIIDATKRMTDPNELSITFLQVGAAPWGSALLRELDDNMVNEGALYDIVDTKSFSQLEQIGLIGAIAEAITALRTPSPAHVRNAITSAAQVMPARQPAPRRAPPPRPPAYTSRVVRQSTHYNSLSPPPAQQQLKNAEQERAEIERKLLEN